MIDYVVKLRFWLRCWDSMTVDVDNDAEVIAAAPQFAREMMRTARFPGSIGADEHREEHIFYVDRVDMERRNEIAEAIEFDGAGSLFPRAASLIPRLARLEIDDVQSKADLRQLLSRLRT